MSAPIRTSPVVPAMVVSAPRVVVRVCPEASMLPYAVNEPALSSMPPSAAPIVRSPASLLGSLSMTNVPLLAVSVALVARSWPFGPLMVTSSAPSLSASDSTKISPPMASTIASMVTAASEMMKMSPVALSGEPLMVMSFGLVSQRSPPLCRLRILTTAPLGVQPR